MSDVQKSWGTWRKMLEEHADLGRSHDKIHPQSLVRTVNDLPLKCIVFNNSGWGLVHLEMERAGQPLDALDWPRTGWTFRQ